MVINTNNIKRHGSYIRLGNGYTAKEGFEGNMQTLTIRKDGKIISTYRGSSLGFAQNLTDEDKEYLASLATR